MEDHNTPADFSKVKKDVAALLNDVTSWIMGSPADAQKKWDAIRPVLEEKLAKTEAHATKFTDAGTEAAGELNKGFSAAMSELKKSVEEAKLHFKKDETTPNSESPV